MQAIGEFYSLTSKMVSRWCCDSRLASRFARPHLLMNFLARIYFLSFSQKSSVKAVTIKVINSFFERFIAVIRIRLLHGFDLFVALLCLRHRCYPFVVVQPLLSAERVGSVRDGWWSGARVIGAVPLV